MHVYIECNRFYIGVIEMHNFALSPVTQKVDKPMISSPIRTPTTFKVWRPSFDGQA